MISIELVLLIVISTQVHPYKIGATNYDFLVNEVKCLQSNPNLCGEQICELKPTETKHVSTLNIGCTLGYPLHQIYISIHLYYDYQKNHFHLINFDEIPFCQYIRTDIGSAILKEVLPLIEPYISTRKIHICPYMGKVTMEHLPVQTGIITPKIPAGNYTLTVRIYDERNQTVIMPQLRGSLKFKRALNVLRG